MVPLFDNFQEVLNYVKSTLAVSLLQYARYTQGSAIEGILLPPEPGLYIDEGRYKLLAFDQPYYDVIAFRTINAKANGGNPYLMPSKHVIAKMPPELRKQYAAYNQHKLPRPINTVDDVVQAVGGLCDRYGNIVLSGTVIAMYSKRLCTVGSMLGRHMQLVRLYTANTFCSMTEYTRNAQTDSYASVIKPEYLQSAQEGYLNPFFGYLNKTLTDFVGEDQQCLYFFKHTEDQILIEKSMDFRIYEYYRYKFKADI